MLVSAHKHSGIVASLSSLAWAWLLLIDRHSVFVSGKGLKMLKSDRPLIKTRWSCLSQVMMYLPAIFVTQTFGKDVNADAKTLEYFGSLPSLGAECWVFEISRGTLEVLFVGSCRTEAEHVHALQGYDHGDMG